MPRRRHTREFQNDVTYLREHVVRLYDPSNPNARLSIIVDGIKAGLSQPPILRAAQVVYEDFAPVRFCIRVMMKYVKAYIRRASSRVPTAEAEHPGAEQHSGDDQVPS